MQSAVSVFHPEAARAVRDAIAEADGNEVFFTGRRGPQHAVAEVQVLARGHQSAVPGLLRGVRPGEIVIHNHPSGVLRPSEPDLELAARWAATGVAFMIVDNAAEQVYVVVEPQEEVQRVHVDNAEIEAAFGPEGTLARTLPGYEHRPQQVRMASEVASALNHDRIAMIEAGTGTGKSLAYLLPALYHAIRNRERVVISTNTINLQEQLLNKDLPFLRDKLGLDFKSVLLKGRSNYLCLRKSEFARGSQDNLFDTKAQAVLASILEWSGKTVDGSRGDLSFVVPEEVWSEVGSDSDDCMRVRSPHFSKCFFFKSRRDAAAADVIVVNHHLLMADLATRAVTGDYTTTAVLPPYQRIILDEAHNLEDVAASYFGTSVTALGLLKSLGRLQSERDEQRGVLQTLLRLVRDPKAQGLIREAMEERQMVAETVRGHFDDVATNTLGFLGVDDPGSDELKLRLTGDMLSHPAIADGVVVGCTELTKHLGAYSSLLTRLLERVRPSSDDHQDIASAVLRVSAVTKRLNTAAEMLAAFPRLDTDNCHWIEVKRFRRSSGVSARLASAPLEVAELLASQVYAKMKSVVFTSATLTVGRDFGHFKRRLGVDRAPAERVATARVESPFDFENQAIVIAPTDMPEPREPRFGGAVSDAVAKAVKITRGRAFILFTSYGLLMRTFRALENELRRLGLNPLRQGAEPRDQLLNRFRRETGSVLFAVDSFWEGVDVPGEALSLVVLVRLPFRVPTEPLQEARVEALQREGRDPFRDFTVPQAVIKFRQGFGRLIRTRKDRGAVMVLDSRLTRKHYGKLFLDSLPTMRVVAEPLAESLVELTTFFTSTSAGKTTSRQP